MKKTVLLYGFQDFKGTMQANALNLFLKPLGAEAAVVAIEDYGRPLQSLLEDNKPEGHKESSLREEALPVRMLVFCNFPEEELDQVLQVCPGCGITRDDLKAVLTETNRAFPGTVLCRMLMEEHRQLYSRR